MRIALEIAAGALALALALWAHVSFWTRRFRLPPTGETLHVRTADGWRLALARRRSTGAPRRRTPVLLVHGIAANHACMDFGMGRLSLAAHLAEAGFEAFSVDLRGHGGSARTRGLPHNWTFDDYLRFDLPAAVDAIREATGAPAVAVVGHSQGALLALAAAGTLDDRVAGVVALAGPAHFAAQRGLALLARAGFLVTGRLNRLAARALSPYAGWWHPHVSQAVWNANNVDGAVYRRVLVNVVENVPPGVLRQFGGWIQMDQWMSGDGTVDYRGALAQARQPAFFLGGADDVLAPPEVVRAAYEAWGGERSMWIAGLEGGCGCEYGHSDLLFGRRAPDEIFPRVRDWLITHVG